MGSRLVMMLLLGLLVGCGKHSTPTGSAPSEMAPQAESPALEPSTAPAPAAVSVPNGTAMADVLSQLTQVVRKYAAENHRVPTVLSELVARGYLARVPEAPPGRKFAIDRKLQVYLADQ